MKLPTSILAGTCICALPLLNSCRSSTPPPQPVIEQHDVTVVQPTAKPKPKPKPVQRESAAEDFRAVTTPN